MFVIAELKINHSFGRRIREWASETLPRWDDAHIVARRQMRPFRSSPPMAYIAAIVTDSGITMKVQ